MLTEGEQPAEAAVVPPLGQVEPGRAQHGPACACCYVHAAGRQPAAGDLEQQRVDAEPLLRGVRLLGSGHLRRRG